VWLILRSAVKIAPMTYRKTAKIGLPSIARFLIFSYPMLLHLAFFSWMRSALFYGAWRYFLLIPMIFAIEIWLLMKRPDEGVRLKEILILPARAAALAFPISVVMLSIYHKAFWPIKVQFFFDAAYEAAGSALMFTITLLVILLLSFLAYTKVLRFRAFFSLYLPLGFTIMLIASSSPFGHSDIGLETKTVFRHSDAKTRCPISGLLTELTFNTSRSTDIHVDELDFYVSYRNPLSFSPKQVSAIVFKGGIGELACLYATGIRNMSSRSNLPNLYYATSAPRTTISSLRKSDLEPELIVNPSFAKLLPPRRREFTDVYVDSRGRTLYAALNEDAGVLKASTSGIGGEFLNFTKAGFAWNGSSAERIVPWPDERYIYVITRLAPAPLVQINTRTFGITGFYIENSIKPWKYEISDAVPDPTANAIYILIPSRSEIIALSHPLLKVMWRMKTPEPMRIALRINARYLVALSSKGKLYAFDAAERKFHLLTGGLHGAGAVEFKYGRLIVATNDEVLLIKLPKYILSEANPPD